ncbi:MAG: phenylacetate--CoA ligase [Porticoccaceae bacterium]|jgi:phenylacetate-CoA ligase|nr:phenylacetate--CoA ligase [Porticoccaceae bacterium]MBT4163300.1 phenylacetate--CoA ligase [Porticoccaceae bacterium]MBT4211455.1 phenylacetate--CoA ligase [Porticoccaceae bacterium]MBT4590496.1 phenylacetate--CoA ligase [Porticoccaceae bacterium]MBT5003754.1 phenylacetate--CoA ligase [Porticoccaceae bacterium]
MTTKAEIPDQNNAQLESIERASIDELRSLQLQRLQWSIKHAYDNVAFYRQKFDQASVHPDHIQSLDDLSKLPFTEKNDLRDNYPFGMFAIPREKVSRIHASSGTTGKPTVVGYSRGDIDDWANVVARSIRAAGGRAGDILHNAYGYGLFTGGLGAHYGAEKLGCTVVPMSGGQTPKQVQLINDFKPRIITVTPSYCLNLIDEFEKQGLDPRASSLEIGIFGAEPWTNQMRVEIEERLGIDAVDIYGLSEVMGPGVAQECVDLKDGPTIWEDYFYPEIIDSRTGKVMPDGESGELVFTSLTKEAMPIIRYRTRDLTRLLAGTSRPMRRMEKISGRSDDMMIVRGVNVFPSQIEEHILAIDGLSPHYQIELHKKGNLDSIKINCEVVSEQYDRAELEKQVAKRIKDMIGVSAEIDVIDVGGVPRSQGKAQRIVDLRGV